jgi:hypothetical protein
MFHRVQVTDTSKHQLFRGDWESGLHGRIAAKKTLLKDTNKKKKKNMSNGQRRNKCFIFFLFQTTTKSQFFAIKFYFNWL